MLTIHCGWINLQAAFSEDFGDLLGSDQLAWADTIQVPHKLAIVFHVRPSILAVFLVSLLIGSRQFPGYPIYKRQVTVLRAHKQPPTRGTMARILAREMSKFLVCILSL